MRQKRKQMFWKPSPFAWLYSPGYPFSPLLTATGDGQVLPSVAQFTLGTFYYCFSASTPRPPRLFVNGALQVTLLQECFDDLQNKISILFQSAPALGPASPLSLLSRASYTLLGPVFQSLPQTHLAVFYAFAQALLLVPPSLLSLHLLISWPHTQFLEVSKKPSLTSQHPPLGSLRAPGTSLSGSLSHCVIKGGVMYLIRTSRIQTMRSL